MFRHQGKKRSLRHNLKIAVVLSFVAGMVSAIGFLSVKQLTTNVTGHFAFFIYDLYNFQFSKGIIFFAFILSFLLGSFTSSAMIEAFNTHKKLNVYLLPIILECLILVFLASFSRIYTIENYSNLVACLLLFSMGLQNSYVTKISNAVVRTTHLTGLFTDLGIDLSHLMFSKFNANRTQIKSNIKLRLYIISFFFFGGLFGAFLYLKLTHSLDALIFAAVILLGSLFYDDFKFRLKIVKRKYKQAKNQRKIE